MKKKIILAICLLMVANLLYGCGKDSVASNPLQEIPVPEILVSKDSVSTSQVKKDVIAREEVQTCFTSSFTEEETFELANYELIKEQINEEDKEDLVYASVTVKNTYFEVVLNVKCVYNYYDKGGWILDEFYIESVEQITPIAPPSKELVTAYITDGNAINDQYAGAVLSSYHGDHYRLENGTLSLLDLEFNGSNCASLFASYQSEVLTVEGNYDLIFEENDWHIVDKYLSDGGAVLQFDTFTSDYSKATGKFTLEGDLHTYDPITYYGSLNIQEINNDQVTYDLSFWLADEINGSNNRRGNVKDGKNVSSTFNPFTGEITVGTYLSGDIMRLRYDCENDCWIEGSYNRFVR